MRVTRQAWMVVVAAAALLGLAGGLVMLGRTSVNVGAERSRAYRAGQTAGFAAGLTQGEADGVRQGRALEVSTNVPADARAAVTFAYTSGYNAGAADIFGTYDGGWVLNAPYVITLSHPSGPIAYEISSRTQLEPGVSYFVCDDG